MTTSILINALGQAIFESCGQALLIYMALQMLFQLFPGISSKYRYDTNYLGLTIICCWFLANLVKIYLHNLALPHLNSLTYNINAINTNQQLPGLLQRAELLIVKYAKYITGLYLTGLLLHAFRLLGGLVHIHHIRKQKNLSQDGLWSQQITLLAKKLHLVKQVSLHFSAHIQIPLTIGHLKPIIIFPLALISNLDNDQVEAILLHELAHIKRNDYLFNLLQCVMETILCFNPFVWLISKIIRTEREYCCDDMVVEEECDSFTYTKALFIIAQQNGQSYSLAMASTGNKKYPLLNRIKRLHTMKTKDSLPKFHLLIAAVVATIGILLAWGIPQYSIAKTKHNKTARLIVYPLDKFALAAPVKNQKKNRLELFVNKKRSVIIYADTATYARVNDTLINASKSKFKIVMEDNKGNKKEYNSINELPAEDKEEFLKENPSFNLGDSSNFAELQKIEMSPEWKMQALAMADAAANAGKRLNTDPKFRLEMKIEAEKLRKQFDSPEWKKQMAEMKINAEAMSKQFNSPEWKKQVEDMKINAEAMNKQFNNPEWKKQQEEMIEKMRAYADHPEFKKQMEELQEKMRAQFDSPEWKQQLLDMKKQSEEMSKQFNSPEWKKQMKDLQRQSQKIEKKFNNPEWLEKQKKMQEKIQEEMEEARKRELDDSLKRAN